MCWSWQTSLSRSAARGNRPFVTLSPISRQFFCEVDGGSATPRPQHSLEGGCLQPYDEYDAGSVHCCVCVFYQKYRKASENEPERGEIG